MREIRWGRESEGDQVGEGSEGDQVGEGEGSEGDQVREEVILVYVVYSLPVPRPLQC